MLEKFTSVSLFSLSTHGSAEMHKARWSQFLGNFLDKNSMKYEENDLKLCRIVTSKYTI